MSELMNNAANRKDFQWQLLTTVSALALLGGIYGTAAEAADDAADRPTVWIELGGQLSRLDDGQEVFAPAFPNSPPRPSIFLPSQKFEGMPLYSIDEYGQILFQPDNSDWVFSASVHYGRSVSDKRVHQQTDPQPYVFYKYYSGANHKGEVFPNAQKFADTKVQNNEQHLILDFQAGRDVGLGLFGNKHGSSVVNLGVRFAQFSSKSNIALKSNPDWHFNYKYLPSRKLIYGQPYHSNDAGLRAARNFHGIGPSISWNASAPFMGNGQDSELSFDWGVNAAFLFGRQRAAVHHQTTARYAKAQFNANYQHLLTVGTPVNTDHMRSHTVTVPNVGGFAGLSFRYSNAKVSFGYRADMFFHAMDGGIDTRKSENIGFYGPFATISVGLGG